MCLANSLPLSLVAHIVWGVQRGKAPLRFLSSPKNGGSKGVEKEERSPSDVYATITVDTVSLSK